MASSSTAVSARGFAVRGRVWAGRGADVVEDGCVLVDAGGHIDRIIAWERSSLPDDLLVVGGPESWVGPGIVDAHVHLAFADSPADLAVHGVTSVRDLGAPLGSATTWRTSGRPAGRSPHVAVAGPLLTAPDGYPSRGWGAEGFARFVAGPDDAVAAVAELDGVVDLVKVAIEPSGGPVPDDATVTAIVDAAHGRGLAVTAHALTVRSVDTAVAAGVDELAHTPVEVLPHVAVKRIAELRVRVVSSLHTFLVGGGSDGALANARNLHAAGVDVVYGTDLGNAGIRPGVDVHELELLAGIGLGRVGALEAATAGAAAAHGSRGGSGVLRPGEVADLVVLDGDPLERPQRWERPRVVVVAGNFVVGP